MALVIDTGPLIALLTANEPEHEACRELIHNATERLVIPAPVLVELDYWIQTRMDPRLTPAFLGDVEAGTYDIEDLLPGDYRRVREICDRYVDSPVGFVDAAVLAVTERLGEPKLASLDHRHFGMMRPRHVEALRLLPA